MNKVESCRPQHEYRFGYRTPNERARLSLGRPCKEAGSPQKSYHNNANARTPGAPWGCIHRLVSRPGSSQFWSKETSPLLAHTQVDICYCNMCVGCHTRKLRIGRPRGCPSLCTYLLEERPSAPMRSELGFIVVVSIFLVIIA